MTLSLFTAAGGAALGAYQQVEANKAIQTQAKLQQERINSMIEQVDTNRLIQTSNLSREANVAMGKTMNAIDHNSRSAVEVVAQRIAAGVAGDTNAVRLEAKARNAALTHQKEDVARSAVNAQKSPAWTAIQMGIEGYRIGGGISSFKDQQEVQSQQAEAQAAEIENRTKIQEETGKYYEAQAEQTIFGSEGSLESSLDDYLNADSPFAQLDNLDNLL